MSDANPQHDSLKALLTQGMEALGEKLMLSMAVKALVSIAKNTPDEAAKAEANACLLGIHGILSLITSDRAGMDEFLAHAGGMGVDVGEVMKAAREAVANGEGDPDRSAEGEAALAFARESGGLALEVQTNAAGQQRIKVMDSDLFIIPQDNGTFTIHTEKGRTVGQWPSVEAACNWILTQGPRADGTPPEAA